MIRDASGIDWGHCQPSFSNSLESLLTCGFFILSARFCILFSFLMLPSTPLPSLHTPISPRLSIDCSDIGAVLSGSCWKTLDLSGFLSSWNKTTPLCNGTGHESDGSACCVAGEPWSTCFLRLAHGSSGVDCSVIKCSFDAYLSASLPETTRAKVYYVMVTLCQVRITIGRGGRMLTSTRHQ